MDYRLQTDLPSQSAPPAFSHLEAPEALPNRSLYHQLVNGRSGFATLATVQSNVCAVEAALLFGCGERTLVALEGPSGTGKSHLLDAVGHRIRRETGQHCEAMPAVPWLLGLTRHEQHAPLLLDDVQDAAKKPQTRQQLRRLLERRAELGRPTLICCNTAAHRKCLPDFLAANARMWHVAHIAEPSLKERNAIVRKMALTFGISLAPELVQVIGAKVGGNGHSLAGTLCSLRSLGACWTMWPEVMRALAVLQPYLACGWDIRDHLSMVLGDMGRDLPVELMPRWPAAQSAMYFMREVVGLGEGDVAVYCGLTPGEVFEQCAQIRLQSDRATLALNIERQAAAVMESLAAL